MQGGGVMGEANLLLDLQDDLNRDNKWRGRFITMAQLVATWSKDPSTKVGAVIVNELRIVCGTGYNGLPRGIRDRPERLGDRPTKYSLIVHAEANALLNSAAPVRGCTLYCTQVPCGECCKLIIQAGIDCVVAEYHGDDQRWMDSIHMLREAGVSILFFNTEAGECHHI